MNRFTYFYPPAEAVEKIEKKADVSGAPCQQQMKEWIKCMKSARDSYTEAGNDTEDAKEWRHYHLKTCLHPYIDARECQVEKKVAVIRKMKEKLSDEQWERFQQRLRYAAHKSYGVDKFDKIWNPDLDYTGYFKAYREHMEKAFKLEEQFEKDKAEGKDVSSDRGKYVPKKFWNGTQVYWDK